MVMPTSGTMHDGMQNEDKVETDPLKMQHALPGICLMLKMPTPEGPKLQGYQGKLFRTYWESKLFRTSVYAILTELGNVPTWEKYQAL